MQTSRTVHHGTWCELVIKKNKTYPIVPVNEKLVNLPGTLLTDTVMYSISLNV